MATPRLKRNRANLPDAYYEGNLEKRSFRDKVSVKRWTVLSGNTLFFFNTNQDATYLEKLDLVDYKSVTDDASQDQNLTAARFILRLKDKTIKFTAPSMEARELWKGYIHAVVTLSVSEDLTMLPGQVHDLHKAVEKETERRRVLPGPELREEARSREPSHSYQGVLPACYLRVSRWEAELLLEREPDRGNLLLRPGGHGNAFTMTTREIFDRPVYKHYSVTQKPDGTFVIDLQDPISCATLEEVVTLLVEQTGGTLTPFINDEVYEKNITFIGANKENGEKSIHVVLPGKGTPAPPLKPVPNGRPAVLEPSLSCEGDLYLSGPEDEQDALPAAPVPPRRLPSIPVAKWRAHGHHGELVIKPSRPVIAPPPLPTAQTITAEGNAIGGVNVLQKTRGALLPPTVKKNPPQGSVGTKQSEDAAPNAAAPNAAAPVATPRRRHGASNLTRSQSDACQGISEELKQKFAKLRLSQNLE